MGVVAGVGYAEFPPQTDWLGKRVRVCFRYDADNLIAGTVVRDDAGPPGVMIIRLDDGRHVLATECQYDGPYEAGDL